MPKHILVVEDQQESLELVVDIVGHLLGHEVLVARNGREAIEIARRERPDLILMDLTLPVMDGWEATRSLKSMPDLKHIPVVALTAHAMIGDKERALQAGCDDYFPKPVQVEPFIEFLQSYLNDNL